MIAAGSLWELIERRAELTPDAPFAFDERDRALSFAGYRAAALRAAAGLYARGIVAESRVTWVLPTWVETMVLAVPPERAQHYSVRVQELLGYSIAAPSFMGYVDGVHPRRLVDPDYRSEHSENAGIPNVLRAG